MGRGSRDKRVDKYVIAMNEIDHMLEKPGFCGMNTDAFQYKDFMQEIDSDEIKIFTLDIPLGVSRAFLEIMSNASDYSNKAKADDPDTRPVEVTITDRRISITNYGYPIPITKNEEGIYIPEGVFGKLRSGQNIGEGDKNRNGIGMYGIGSKAVNVFSKYFKVDIVDPHYKKRYVQVWKNNSKEVGAPEITKSKEDSRVTVTYELDFKRFGMKCYSDREVMLFRRFCADISFNDNNPIILNESECDFVDYKKYATAYFGECHDIIMVEDNDIRVIVADPIDRKRGSHIISFVNSMCTPGGGTHVAATADALCKLIKEKLNKELSDESKINKITPIKNLLSMIISARVVKPNMPDAGKTKLVSPTLKFEWPTKIVNKIHKWEFVKVLKHGDLLKRQKLLTSTDGKKVKQLAVDKYPKHIELDANFAGGPKSDESTLFVVEGFSAAAYVKILINMLDGTSYNHGIFVVGGKFVNVTGCEDKPEKLAKHDVVCALKMILGLAEGCDYTEKRNFKKLRYGNIVIITDADNDGSHIRALVINYFARYFPSLIDIGMVKLMRTPMVRGNKGRQIVSFYSTAELEEWTKNNSRNGWKFRFFKGLGSESKKDIEIDMSESVYLSIVRDKKSMKYLDFAFDKKMSNKRKDMIYNRQEYGSINVKKSDSYRITTLIKLDYVDYVITSLTRAIPGIDGFKDAIRKILYLTTKEPIGKEFKLTHLAGELSSKVDYHHGEQSAFMAIICLARDYLGSNNLPCLQQHGQFGSRLDSGEDHGQPRYLFCSSPWWMKLIFHPDDNISGVLDYNVSEEGNRIEPSLLLPVIPTVMVNGVKGISCGYTSNIPAHSVLDVCEWLLSRIETYESGDNGLPHILTPHYNWFTGEVEYRPITKKVNKKEIDEETQNGDDDHNVVIEEDELSEEEDQDNDKYYELTTSGRYYYKKGLLMITELPIGVQPSQIKNKLLDLVVNDRLSDMEQDCGGDYVWFSMPVDKSDLDEVLKIAQVRKSTKITRITVLDEDRRPVALKNTNQLMEMFFNWRIKKYELRRDVLIQSIITDLNEKNLRYKFIKLVLSGKIVVNKRKKSDIVVDMESHGIPGSIFSKVKLKEFSKEQLDKISDEVNMLKSKLEDLKNSTPSSLWANDINQFKSEYMVKYNEQKKMKLQERITRLKKTIDTNIKSGDNSSVVCSVLEKEIKMCKKQLSMM